MPESSSAGKTIGIKARLRGLRASLAAGLVAHGVHEFNEAGLIPPVIEHVWDTNGFIDEKSTVGELLKALVGYNGNPSLTEVISYIGYFVILGWVMLKGSKVMTVRSTTV